MTEERIGFTTAGQQGVVAQPQNTSEYNFTAQAQAQAVPFQHTPQLQFVATTNTNNDNNNNQHQHQHQHQHQPQSETPKLTLHSHRQNHNSSKLPAFRFADRSSPSAPTPSSTSTSLSSHHRVVPSATATVPFVSQTPPDTRATVLKSIEIDDDYTTTETTAPAHSNTTLRPDPRQRVSNNELALSSANAHHQDLHLKRTTSYPLSTPVRNSVEQHSTPSFADTSLPFQPRRATARSSLSSSDSDVPPHSLKRAAEGSSSAAATSSPDAWTPPDSVQGQRELLLIKSLGGSKSSPPDERRVSFQRPPVSYKPPPNANTQSNSSTPVRVPPIRGFRSSGSRRSLNLDTMNYKSRTWDVSDESPNETGFDRTLRALEGRNIADIMQMTPPSSARYDVHDADDGGDVFLKIAREEANHRNANDDVPEEGQGSMSRVQRSHRRPLSTNVASYQPTSPPAFIRRRMSDQQERAQSSLEENQLNRSNTHRSVVNKAMSAHPLDNAYRSSTGGVTLRPSPLTHRGNPQQEPDYPVQKRRRSSVTEQNTAPPARSSGYRSSGAAVGQSYPSKPSAYNSSPLVRSFDFTAPRESETTQEQVEGTESTTSNTAPSTVWDELDELKSRIHRLELTGKLPSTSAAAVSRLTDERPPTANTAATTISSSPKRPGLSQAQANEAATPTQREYPVLQSALSKSKPFLNPEIYRALEAVANDAMSLSSMMGVVGQLGPISSGASTIGSGTTITDRQLRRKADSVCRSLTELCVALGEDVAQARPTQASHNKNSSYGSQGQPQQSQQTPQQSEGPSTPTTSKIFSVYGESRRPSLAVEQNILPNPQVSPSRAMSKFEERRNTLLNGSQLPSPRASGSGPTTPQDTAVHRKSSLLISRTRRAATEEPEEQFNGRRSSLLLRSRRGGTEEPEEGRQTAMLRSRRGTIGDGEEESRFGAPSRAYTEVSGKRGSKQYTEVATTTRGPTRSYVPQAQREAQEAPSQRISALPQRRFMSSSIGGSRLVAPTATSALPTRKYLERSAPERDTGSVIGRPGEERERHQRYYSMGQAGVSLSRTNSLSTRRSNNRDRDSVVTNISNAATAGGYH